MTQRRHSRIGMHIPTGCWTRQSPPGLRWTETNRVAQFLHTPELNAHLYQNHLEIRWSLQGLYGNPNPNRDVRWSSENEKIHSSSEWIVLSYLVFLILAVIDVLCISIGTLQNKNVLYVTLCFRQEARIFFLLSTFITRPLHRQSWRICTLDIDVFPPLNTRTL